MYSTTSASTAPPSLMSRARPAMSVATVTAPRRPACAITSLSRIRCIALAVIICGRMPCSQSRPSMISASATLPTRISTGKPFAWASSASASAAWRACAAVLWLTGSWSTRFERWNGSMCTTSLP